jgi:hypothetical protein
MVWAYPEDIPPGAKVGLAMAWFPYPQVEYNEIWPWREGEPPPPVPKAHLLGEWRPSPCYESFHLMRNYKIVPAVAGLFPEGGFIKFYARGGDWLVPAGTPQIVMLFDEPPLHAPHEPPAYLR